MAFLEVGGRVIHIADEGPRMIGTADENPRAAPALVFANSLGTDFRLWDAVVARLGDRFRTIRFDKRGHGLSADAAEPFSIEDHVDDLAGVLDRLAVTSAVVIGLSVGGMIALGLAARRPDLVRGLVLSNTAHRIGSAEMWDARISAIRAHGLASIADAVMERWFSPEFRRDHASEVAGWRAMLSRTPAEGYVATCAAIRDGDYEAAARGVSVPTLCIAGSADGSTPPEVVARMADLVPGAFFTIVPGVGHLPPVEAPEAFANLLTTFIAENRLG